MFSSPFRAALTTGSVLLASLVTAACANQATGSPAASIASGPGPSASGSPGVPASGVPASGVPASGAPAASACAGATPVAGPVVRVFVEDESKRLCLSKGTEIVVLLRGSRAARWMGITSSSLAVLARHPDPELKLQIGWTGAAFEAVAPGTAYISASMYPCGTATPHPPKLECGVIIGYRVNIVVAP